MTTPDSPVQATPDGVRVALRVIPRSPHTRLDGVRDGRILLRVTAPPVDRAANQAVVEIIARLVDVPKRAVRLIAGETTRNKVVVIDGVTEGRVRRCLTAPGSTADPTESR